MNLGFEETLLASPAVSTLLWDRDELVDVTSGLRVGLDGSISEGKMIIGYPFDRAVGVRQNGTHWSIAYANRHTKGLLLKNGSVHREINRSFYLANEYDYPVTIAVARAGRVIVIHCPNAFDILEVEDAETGETLATAQTRGMEFHSRLAVSSGGRYLLDAGWFWHPIGSAWLCNLDLLLEDPLRPSDVCTFGFGGEIDSAAFLGDDSVIITSTSEIVNEDTPPKDLGPRQIGVWSIADSRWRSTAVLAEPSGLIMPWRDWAISFYGYPKAIDLASGAIVQRWDHVISGNQAGSIDLGDPPPPPIALDSQNGRFAVAGPDGITVIELSTRAHLGTGPQAHAP